MIHDITKPRWNVKFGEGIIFSSDFGRTKRKEKKSNTVEHVKHNQGYYIFIGS